MISEIDEAITGVGLVIFGFIGFAFTLVISTQPIILSIGPIITITGGIIVIHSVFRKPQIFFENIKQPNSREVKE